MNRNARLRGALCSVLGLGAALAQAGPYDPSRVAGDARWVVAVDLDAARASALGKALLTRLVENADYAALERTLVDVAGFMPATDLHDVTAYADAAGGRPTFVATATFDAALVRNALMLAGSSRVDLYGQHTVISWTGDGDRRQYACLYDDRTIVIGDDDKRLARALDVLDHPDRSAETTKSLPAPAATPAKVDAAHDGTWLFASTADAGRTLAKANNPVLAQVGAASFELGESADGHTVLSVATTAATPTRLGRLFDLATGARALALVASNVGAVRDARGALVAELARSVDLTRDGGRVVARVRIDNGHLIELVGRAIEQGEAEANEPAK